MQRAQLIDPADSILIVIDVQDPFLDKLAPGARQPLVEHLRWLIGTARWLGIPIVATAEDIPALGGVTPAIADLLPPGTTIHNKLIFGLAADPAILAAVAATERRTAILVGLETDVCVTHSALGMAEHGFRVAVVADATGSPAPAHAAGLDRLRDAGITLLSTKGLYYEWLRTVERANRCRAECTGALGVPAGW
jgi:nicotinamidase-related amidase